MPTKVQLGQSTIYSGGLPVQAGGGALQNLQKANAFAKQHKVISKGDAVLGALGLRDYVNTKTGGAYGVAVDYAKTKGYGKKKHRKRR